MRRDSHSPAIRSASLTMWKASSRQRLASIVGEENVSVEATRAQMWIGDPPEAYACPFSVEQLCEIVKAADAESWRIAPVGNGTKFHMGARPREIDVAISTC